MNKLEATKFVANIVVGSGVTKIVHGIIANNTNPEKVTEKVAIVAGAVVLGGIAKDASKVYTGAKIDTIVDVWKKLKAKTEEAQKDQ